MKISGILSLVLAALSMQLPLAWAGGAARASSGTLPAATSTRTSKALKPGNVIDIPQSSYLLRLEDKLGAGYFGRVHIGRVYPKEATGRPSNHPSATPVAVK